MRLDRETALDTALGQIERNFGKGAVMRMSDQAQVSVGAISTGSLPLDLALGIGGLPRGRVVEIYGPESSGKTTLVYHVIAEAQRQGGICAFIDAEHAMDPVYAKNIGVNIDELLVSQPDTGEQALEICELLVRSGALSVVAIDSVAALTPKAEIEGEMGDSHVGLQARLMSQALRKLAGTLNRTETICIFTNQLREKIGVMFGSPETTPGGRALKFYASVRLDIRRIETLKDGVEAIGNRVRVKVAKNKVSPPFKQAEFDIIYGQGIPWESTVLDAALERKIVQKSGSYFSFGDERLGQGRQNAAAFLTEHPDLVQQILQAIQDQVPEGQIVSARLLAQPESTEATPVLVEVEVEARGRGRSRRGCGRRLGEDAPMRTVTALHPERRDRVRVDLDGEPWRTLPAAAVVSAGLRVGAALDRERARELGRSLRRFEALDAAAKVAGSPGTLDRRARRPARAAGRPALRAGRGGRDDGSPRLRRRRANGDRPRREHGITRLRRRGDPLRPRGSRHRRRPDRGGDSTGSTRRPSGPARSSRAVRPSSKRPAVSRRRGSRPRRSRLPSASGRNRRYIARPGRSFPVQLAVGRRTMGRRRT